MRIALEVSLEETDMRDNRQRRRREDLSNDHPLRRHKDLLDLLQQDFVDPTLPPVVVVKERRMGEERRRTDRRQSIPDVPDRVDLTDATDRATGNWTRSSA